MRDGFRLGSVLSSIVYKRQSAVSDQNFHLFVQSVSEKIMANYRQDAPALRGLSIRRQAIRLTTDVLVSLEYDYEASLDADDDEARAAEILTTIEWLRDCLQDFGETHGEQVYVAECLAHHETVLQALLGDPATRKPIDRPSATT